MTTFFALLLVYFVVSSVATTFALSRFFGAASGADPTVIERLELALALPVMAIMVVGVAWFDGEGFKDAWGFVKGLWSTIVYGTPIPNDDGDDRIEPFI